MLTRSTDDQLLAVARAARLGNFNGLAARHVLAGDRALGRHDFRGRSGGHHFATQATRAGAEVDHVVRAFDGLLIVFDHQHRIAQVAQLFQSLQQALIVSRVQADGWLVQNIQHATKLRPYLRRQANALCFTA